MRRQLCFNSAARPWKQTDSSIFSVTNGSTIYHPRNHLVYVFSNETKYWNYLAWELVIYSSTSVAKPSRHSSDELFRKIFKENVPRRLFLRISKSSKTFFFSAVLFALFSLSHRTLHIDTHTLTFTYTKRWTSWRRHFGPADFQICSTLRHFSNSFGWLETLSLIHVTSGDDS